MRKARGSLSIAQAFGLLVLAFVLLYGTIALGALVRVAARQVTFGQAMSGVMSEPLGPCLAQLAALGFVTLLGVRLAYGDASLREALRIRPVRASTALLAIVAGLALQFPLVELTTIVSDLVPAIALDDSQIAQLERMTRVDGPVRGITVPLAMVVLVPLSEEALFRGLLLPSLRPRLGALGALVLTSVLFGVFHGAAIAAIYATVAGLVIGAISIRTRSLLPSIAFHGAFNAVPILLPEAVVPIPGFNVGEQETHLAPGIVVTTLVVAGLALALLWRSAREGEEEGEDR